MNSSSPSKMDSSKTTMPLSFKSWQSGQSGQKNSDGSNSCRRFLTVSLDGLSRCTKVKAPFLETTALLPYNARISLLEIMGHRKLRGGKTTGWEKYTGREDRWNATFQNHPGDARCHLRRNRLLFESR